MGIENAALYLNLLFVILIGTGMLVGLWRGLRASLYWLIVKVIFYVFFFATITLVVGWLYTMNLPFVPMLVQAFEPGATAGSMEAALPIIMESLMGETFDAATASEPLMEFGQAVMLFALKIVYAIFYFTVFKMLYTLVFFIVRKVFFSDKKVVKEKGKRRTAGLVFGAANGVLSIFVLLVFLGGLMSLVDDGLAIVHSMDSLEDNEQNVLLSTPAQETDELDEMREMVDAYHNNGLVNLLSRWSTTDELSQRDTPVNLHLFDLIFSMDYRDRSIALRNEVGIFRDVSESYFESEYAESEDLSDLHVEMVDEMVRLVSTSELVVTLMPVGIEVMSDENEIDLGITRDELYEIPWDEEIRTMGSVASDTLVMLDEGGFFEAGEDAHLDATLDGDTIRDIFSKMSDSQAFVLGASVGSAYYMEHQEEQDEQENQPPVLAIPEAIDWADEYLALGTIFGDLFDTGITLRDVEESEVDVLLDKLSAFDFTVLLDSEMISETMINVMTQEDTFEAVDALVIPDDVVWRDTYENEQINQEGELRKMMKAFNDLGDNAHLLTLGDVTDPFDMLSDLDDALFDSLFESRVLEATLGNMLYTVTQDDESIIVPPQTFATISSKGEDVNYIVETEMRSMMDALTSINMDALGEGENWQMAIFEDMDDEEIEALFESGIMHATFSNILMNMETDGELTLPYYSNQGDSIRYTEDGIEYIDQGELTRLLTAYIEVGDDVFADGEALDVAVINENSDIIFASSILHATFSDILKDLEEDETEEFLVFPEQTYSGDPLWITYGSAAEEVTYMDVDEVIALLEAFEALDVADDAQAFDFSLFSDASTNETVVASSIMHATLSDVFIDMDGNGLYIPPQTVDNDNDMIQNVSGVNYMEPSELKALLEGIALLDYSDSTEFEAGVDAQVVASLSDEDLLKILESGVLHNTIDTMIKTNPNIEIPHEAQLDATRYGLTDLTQEEEIVDFINATMVVVNDGDFTAVDFDFTDISQMDQADADIIFESKIVRYTMNDDIELAADLAGYTFDNTDYVNDDPNRFLTKDAVMEFLDTQ